VLVQSVLAAQSFPMAQSAGHEPPQSTSVSVPFFAPSMQVGAAHVLPLQTSLAQSDP
jgi:hypothetical protein